MLDIARDKRKILKKEKAKQKLRKSQITTVNIFIVSFFYIEKLIFCQKTYLGKLNVYCFICITVVSRSSSLKMQ